jgi:molybdopterin converting factor small subunit
MPAIWIHMIRILFFGPVAERMKAREMEIEFAPGMTLHDVIARIGAQQPNAFSIVSFIAVNQNQVHDKQMALNDNDEIAFMAKYSGG